MFSVPRVRRFELSRFIYISVTYIKLENLVSKYRKPCVVDIKMGKKTYDPEAGPAKIAKEMTKFPHVEKFGFQFTGMQVRGPSVVSRGLVSTLFIMDTGRHVLWQTVKMQMKCCIKAALHQYLHCVC